MLQFVQKIRFSLHSLGSKIHSGLAQLVIYPNHVGGHVFQNQDVNFFAHRFTYTASPFRNGFPCGLVVGYAPQIGTKTNPPAGMDNVHPFPGLDPPGLAVCLFSQ
jgi:hypothetical protein